MSDLSELRERLEKAEGPSRELDAAICEALNLVEVEQDDIIGPHPVVKLPGKTYCTAAPLTSSLDAAVALVERVLPPLKHFSGKPSEGWKVGVYRLSLPGQWSAWLRRHAEEGVECMHSTPALALCIALVKALEKAEA